MMQTRNYGSSTIGAAIALALALGAFGTPASAAKSADKSSQSSADKKFITQAAADGLGEVEVGKLAQQKAENPDVKQLAEKLVQDHTKANDQLKQIASAQGITLPEKPAKSAQRQLDKLQKLSGANFDREFVTQQVSDHKKDIKEFNKEAKSGKDDQVKSFASDTVGALEEHLKMAQAAQTALKTKPAKP